MANAEQRVGVGVGCIVTKDSQVLLGQRKGEHGTGMWNFPGGKLEYGEEIEDCVRRETKEETSLKVNNIRFGSITNDIFESEGKHNITIFMVCDYESGEPQVMEADKNDSWEWFNWGNFPQPLFLPLAHLLEQGFNPFEK